MCSAILVYVPLWPSKYSSPSQFINLFSVDLASSKNSLNDENLTFGTPSKSASLDNFSICSIYGPPPPSPSPKRSIVQSDLPLSLKLVILLITSVIDPFDKYVSAGGKWQNNDDPSIPIQLKVWFGNLLKFDQAIFIVTK